MKGVILAGGLGTRLRPLTLVTNKHLLPVFDLPMVFYPIKTLVNAGIKEVAIVVGNHHGGDFISVIKNGKDLGLTHIEYLFQEGEGGIPDALSLAESFADGQPIIVILGDNTTDADIGEAIKSFKDGATVFLKEVKDPQRFGVATVGEDGLILKIEEKPQNPESNFAVTGLYIYDNSVFDKIRECIPSRRGELEITDVNEAYRKERKLRSKMLEGFWSDAGTPESLFRSCAYWALKNPQIREMLERMLAESQSSRRERGK